MEHHPPPPFPGSYVVQSGFLAGCYPNPGRGDISALTALGITHFLDLTETGEQEHYGAFLPTHASHRRMPIRDFSIPTPANMSLILDHLDAALASGHHIYLHCLGGLGRTGTVVGCFLVRHGLSGDEALERIRQLRLASGCSPDSPETDAQRDLVRGWPTVV